MSCKVFGLSSTLLFNSLLYAQDEANPTSSPTDSTALVRVDTFATGNAAPALHNRTTFGHDIEIYNWRTDIGYQNELAHGWQLVLYENFSSVLQQQARGEAWKDDHNGGIRLTRQLRKRWRLEAEANSNVFFDEFTGSARNTASEFSNNDFSLHRFDLRSTLDLARGLRLTPGLGYRWEDILNRKDYGPHAEIRLALAPTLWSDYEHQFDLSARIDDLPVRRNDDLTFVYGVSRQFERNASDSLFVRFSHARRENYFTASFIDQLNRNDRGLENRLQYRVGSSWIFQLNSELSEAEVEVGRRLYAERNAEAGPLSRFQHKDLVTHHRAQLLWQTENLSNDFSLLYRSRRRNYEIPDSLRV
ncbi:hypothetical protein HUU05_26045, partial [candidate division KSB1 bacterium]|nr:hypothetical protein [candidate division KSB1 bacterium]